MSQINLTIMQNQTEVHTTSSKKKNASAQQKPLVSMPPASVSKGKKRALSTLGGGALDLTGPLTVSPEVIEALRARVLELEEQLEDFRPTKRAKTTATTIDDVLMASSSKAVPIAAQKKAEDKKLKAHVKKVFDRLKKECKADTNKFQGSEKMIKFDEVYNEEEFHALFDGKGLLIQPTPKNKPSSAVHIVEFPDQPSIRDFFGAEFKDLKGNMWTRGGIHTGKSVKIGACDVTIVSFEVSWSRNNMKATFKFQVTQVGDLPYCGGSRGAWLMF